MTHAALKDLLPCPFCGKPANFDAPSELYGSPYFTIRCCVAHSKGYDQQEVGAAWNRRAALSAMEGEAVAWQGRNLPDGQWTELSKPVFDAMKKRGHDGIELRALYTAPPPQQADERSALLALADRMDASAVKAHMSGDIPNYGNTLASFAFELRALATHPTPSPPQQVEDSLPEWDEENEVEPAMLDASSTHPTPSPGPQGGGEAVAWISWSSAMMLREAHEADTQQNVMAWAKPRGHDAIPLYVDSTPPAHQPGEVGDIERTAAAMWEALQYRGKWPGDASSSEQSQFRKMAAAVLAALAPREDGHG